MIVVDTCEQHWLKNTITFFYSYLPLRVKKRDRVQHWPERTRHMNEVHITIKCVRIRSSRKSLKRLQVHASKYSVCVLSNLNIHLKVINIGCASPRQTRRVRFSPTVSFAPASPKPWNRPEVEINMMSCTVKLLCINVLKHAHVCILRNVDDITLTLMVTLCWYGSE